MTEAEYLDELERRADAYIEVLSQEGNPFEAQQKFQSMADVFTVKRLIETKRRLDAMLSEASAACRTPA